MVGDQVVNTALRGFGVHAGHVGSTADAVGVVAVLELAGSVLARMGHGALDVFDVLFHLRDFGAATASGRRTKLAAFHVQV